MREERNDEIEKEEGGKRGSLEDVFYQLNLDTGYIKLEEENGVKLE